MPEPFADSPEFRRLLRDDTAAAPEPDLVRVALEVARDAYPGLPVESYLARVDELAGRVRDRCPSPDRPREALGHVNWVLFVEEGFRGNTGDYYDPRNSYLNEVLDRKTGIPITLSLLYWRLAAAVGLAVGGMNFPAHFMLRVGKGGDAVFVDAFESGSLLDRDACAALLSSHVDTSAAANLVAMPPCRPADVVARLLRNLKAIYLRQGDLAAAVPVQTRLTALSPDNPGELRDLALLLMQTDRPADAIAPLQSYLEVAPDDPEADDLRTLLRAARREVARWN